MIFYLLCSIIAWLCYIIINEKLLKNKPPGPFPWPVLGNLMLLRKLTKKLCGQHKAFLYLSEKYNSNVFSLKLGSSDFYIVSGYDAVRKILKDEDFHGRPWNEFIKIRNMGLRKGITMNDGPECKEMRGWLVRCLKNLGFGRVEMSDKINNELSIILDELQKENGKIIKMKPLIAPAVINVLWNIATGKRIDDNDRLNYFVDLMTRRAKAFDMAGGMLSVFPWIRYLAPIKSGYEVLVKLNNELREFLLESIDEHKKNYVEGKEMDLIDMFLREMYFGKGPEAGFTEEQLLMILIDLFIAGLQTTTVTLDFLFLFMTVHQDIQEKLQNELDKILCDNQLPQLSHRQLLPYSEAVITESQRLRLVTPIIGPRRVLNNTKINSYDIPKNSCVLMNIHSVHFSPDNFEDPEAFKPERFIENGAHVPDKKLILFGGGQRRCPGEVLARSSVFLLFTGIMKNYKLLPSPGNNMPDLEPLPGLTISPKPYDCLLVSRSLQTNKKLTT